MLSPYMTRKIRKLLDELKDEEAVRDKMDGKVSYTHIAAVSIKYPPQS